MSVKGFNQASEDSVQLKRTQSKDIRKASHPRGGPALIAQFPRDAYPKNNNNSGDTVGAGRQVREQL